MKVFARKQKQGALKNRKGFSLLEVIFAITLIGAAVVAMVGYYGSKFSSAGSDAIATRVIDDLRTISAATQLYKTKEGSVPADINAIVTKGGYLNLAPTTPVPNSTVLGIYEIDATGSVYSVGPTLDTVVTLQEVTESVCKAINTASYGLASSAAVPAALDNTKNVQCYGAGADVAGVGVNTAMMPIFVPNP